MKLAVTNLVLYVYTSMNLNIIIGILMLAQVGYLVNAFWFMKAAQEDYPQCNEDCSCFESDETNLGKS